MTADIVSAPTILNNRFVLATERREGGMGSIQRAYDLSTGKHVAIKRMLLQGDAERQKTSFQREADALQKLEHPNIVSLVRIDQDADARWYLAIEWLEETIEAYVQRKGAIPWNRFYSTIGKPVLDALEFAQTRYQIAHRDLNPRNIMMTDKEVPKITDYGISKVFGRDSWMPVSGKTFVDARTPGYSPLEVDDGVYTFSRDCFGFAAVAVYCLVGRQIEGDTDLGVALHEAAVPEGIRAVLEKALSEDRRTRTLDAKQLRLDIEAVEARRSEEVSHRYPCFLDLTSRAEERIAEEISLDDGDAVRDFILDELRDVHGLALHRYPDQDASQASIDIFGSSWSFRGRIGGRDRDIIEIYECRELDVSVAASKREYTLRLPIQFSFTLPTDPPVAADILAEIWQRVAEHDRRRTEAWQAARSERIFKAWKGYLRDRVRFEAERSAVMHFTSRRVEGNKVTFTLDSSASADNVGEERLVRVGGRHVFGTVQKVVLDQVVFEVQSGVPDIIPRRGQLLLNTVAAERSLANQNNAIDAIMYGRAANQRLKAILLDPSQAKPPIIIDKDHVAGSKLEGEKLAVLKQALGTNEVLAIAGPPGTGKTDLISEIVVRWLTLNPGKRILLSSQTHTALDEAIERIAGLVGDGEDIVRIGRADDERISDFSKGLLLEEKVNTWAMQVRANAEKNLTEWAVAQGVNRDLVELGMLVERYLQTIERRREVDSLIREAEHRIEIAEEDLEGRHRRDEKDYELEEKTVVLGDEITLLKNTRRALHIEERTVREQLRSSVDMGPDIANLRDPEELREWQDLYLQGSPEIEACKDRLKLLEEWLLKVGKTGDFNAAVVNDARVIAGTCVGVAGVRGIEDVQFDLCIVDEASKATSTEILIPMSKSKKWIVVGDPEQLPPFFEDFGEDLLEQFDEEEDIRPTILDRFLKGPTALPLASRAQMRVQRRMIAPIGELVSHCFYDDNLKSPIESHGLDFSPKLPAPVTWYTTSGERKREEQRHANSYDNALEAHWIKRILDDLQATTGDSSAKIAVAIIAGYSRQVGRLNLMARKYGADWPNLTIVCNTVDAFQGKQADVCIYSVVRSNGRKEFGFLREKPRLNVALSRAKSALIIVGDHLFCRTAKGLNPFRKVIDWVESHPGKCHLGPLQ
ncbi:Serine/threonine-protein kinase PrkC [Agrobacterium fabrum]|uniref:AAA domain-containing protein n=1 Tax=Agrobacterium fabrum TaxID=1176649 RepID=UPI001D424471|nr:AAA domain-containing protein [Agrobacterium fabrum]CAH0270232.1 Serine/threonine-protein kinase PrkC [Agrobacterium fabrum]CAH0279451.1 Serine/threonine-protein kinase PrkC [Agrobacterium fabrum]